MKSIDKYCGEKFGYSVNKTFMFELKPVRETLEYIKQRKIIENDKVRTDKAVLVKDYIDRLHRKFIQNVLTAHCTELKTEDLGKLYSMLQNENSDKNKIRKSIKEIEAAKRKQVSEWFKKDDEYKKLFGKTLFDELIATAETEEERNSINHFKGYLQYFLNFNQVREYVYSDEEKHNTIPFRIINENLRIYFENLNKLEDIGIDTTILYQFPVTDEQIACYNLVIGGNSKEIKGYNQLINEKKLEVPYLTQLYKNILSETKPLFTTESFKTTEEVKETCKELFESVAGLKNDFRRITSGGDESKIYIHRKNISKFSFIVSGDPLLVKNVLANENIIVTDYVSIGQIKQAFINQKKTGYYENIELNVSKYYAMESVYADILKNISECDLTKITDLQTDKVQVLPLKDALDKILELFHQVKIVFLDEDYVGKYDTEFYNVLNKVYNALKPVVSVYNKTRNFVSKKLGEQKKLPLNFESSTLLGGWDVNKESASNSVIFYDEKEGKYYLGIFNVENRPSFTAKPGTGFKKMYYKYLPQPNKMIPHVVFSKKGLDTFSPSKEIIEGYKKGLHLKGENFDINFCHKLIDFFKNCIYQYESWKVFDFKFSNTTEYNDLSDFYNEINQQGYKVKLSDVDRDEVYSSVSDGKLYLFEITNRFMSGKSHKRHIPSEIFKSIFDKDSTVQLNGGAEIFYRPEMLKPKITHKKGSYLVNKYTTNGFSVSDEDYKSIYEHLNYNKPLTSSARTLLNTGTVVYKKADYDLIKDRRYSSDKFEFHVPVTINYKYKSSCSVKEFNKSVLNELRENHDINILSVTRGENNLVYAVLQTQEGKILLEKSFNIIGEKTKVNYKDKLQKVELSRNEARKNWQNVQQIKDLKEGFMGNVLNEIVKIMIENNAVLVTEDLSGAFKDSRMKIETNVYKIFETSLINKLSCLIQKNAENEGSIKKPYQLTPPVEGFSKAGSQYGWVFFINPAYISKIVPASTFINIFSLNSVNTFDQKKKFFLKFDSIEYTGDSIFLTYNNGVFVPKFKGKNVIEIKGSRTLWNKETKKYENYNTKDYISEAVVNLGIEEKGNIKPLIEKLQFNIRNNKGLEKLIQAVKIVCEMKTFAVDNYHFVSPTKDDNYDGSDIDFIACVNLAEKFKLAIRNTAEESFLKQPKTEELINSKLQESKWKKL